MLGLSFLFSLHAVSIQIQFSNVVSCALTAHLLAFAWDYHDEVSSAVLLSFS